MKRFLLLILSVVIIFSLNACLAPSGDTPEQKRASIQRMHSETLTQLYRQRPTAESVISKAAGYAVFSNISGMVLFIGGGGGYGVAVDQSSGQNTYMQMGQAGVGLGLGLQDVRVVFVFHSTHAFNSFVNSGWEFGGQVDVAAKARDKGSALTGEISIDAETTIYTLSESGLLAKANLAGSKYWKDDNLNF